MAQPSSSTVHLDQILTNMSTAFLQKPDNYIAGKVFPRVLVKKQSDKYYTFDKGAFLRDDVALRAPDTESEGSGYTVSRDSYFCDVYALHKDISDQLRANTDQPLDPDRNATQFLTQQFLTRQEKQFISDYIKTTVWGTDVTPANLWSDQTLGDPIGDVATGKETVLAATGFEPNTMVLGYKVWRQLINHPEIIERIKFTSADAVSTDILARYFELENIYVAKAVVNSANEGAADSIDLMFGKHALLCYSAPSAGLETPSAGYTFVWDGVSDGMGAEIGMFRIPMPLRRSERIEGQMAWDNKVVAKELGYFFNSVVS